MECMTPSIIQTNQVISSHIVFVKEQFIFALVCNIVYAGQLLTAKAMVVSWMYNSRHHYKALVYYHAIKIDEYMCKTPFCRLVYINMMWLTRPSTPVYNAAADSCVCAASEVAVAFFVCLSRPGLHQHIRPHLFS